MSLVLVVLTPVRPQAQGMFGATLMFDIAYSPELNLYVAVGNDGSTGRIYASQDGLKWVASKTDADALGVVQNSSIVWWKSAGLFVVYTASAACYISDDGFVWKKQSVTFPGNGGIATDGQKLYAFGGSSVWCLNSFDDIQKYQVTSDANTYISGIAAGGGKIIANYGFKSWLSIDSGKTWSAAFTNSNWGTASDCVYSSAADKFLVTAATQGYLMSVISSDMSVEACTMTGSGVSSSNRATAIGCGGGWLFGGTAQGDFFAAQENAQFSTAWKSITPASPLPVKSVAYGNGVFAAVCNDGSGSNIFVADPVSGTCKSELENEDALKINSVGFYDDNGNILTAIPSGGNILSKVSVSSVTPSPVCSVTAAYYPDGRLKQVTLSKQVTNLSGSAELDGLINAGSNMDGVYIKLFILDGLKTLKPYSPSYRFPFEYYVSGNGNDHNEGSINSPFATLEKARTVIRSYNMESCMLQGGAKVYLRGGSYKRSGTFDLAAIDSGRQDSTVQYMAYPGEEATVTGGVQLEGSWFEPASPDIKERIINTNVRDSVLQVDLRSHGIIDLGRLSRRGSDVSEKVQPQSELYINGEKMTLSRWPNADTVSLSYSNVINYGSSSDINNGCCFNYSGYSEPDNWFDVKNIWVSGVLGANYAYDYFPVDHIDTVNKAVYLSQGYITNYYTNPFFYYDNILEEIDSPGEYYIDYDNAMLYILPPAGFDADKDNINLTMLNEPLININGASYLTFENITFQGGKNDGIIASGVNNFRINKCDIDCFGEDGISINGTNSGLSQSRVHDIGYNAVILGGGDPQTLTAGENYVSNCDISKFAQIEKSYKTGVMMSYGSVGNSITNCEIHNAPHAGVIIYGNDHKIENNKFYDLVREFYDMDMIYLNCYTMPWQRGVVIKHNYFYGLGRINVGGVRQMIVSAIRTDNNGHALTVDGNIFQNIGYTGSNQVNAIVAQGSRNNVTNNIFLDCSETYLAQQTYNAQAAYDMSNQTNINIQNKINSLAGTVYQTKYPELFNFFNEHFQKAATNRFEKNAVINIYVTLSNVNGAHQPQGYKGAPQLMNASNNYVTNQDPGFVDLAGENLNLRQDSEIFTQIPEFEPIPFDEIGVQIKAGIEK